MNFHLHHQAQEVAVVHLPPVHQVVPLQVAHQARAHLDAPNISVTLSNQKRKTLTLLYTKMGSNKLSSALKRTYSLGATFKKRKKMRKTKWYKL